MTAHLITGVGGQDGLLLSRHLVAAGHRVVGTSLPGSEPVAAPPAEVVVVPLDITDRAAFAHVIAEQRPAVVHNLAGLSSVSRSWREPEETKRVNDDAVLAMLEVLADHPEVAFVQASSSEIFGPGTGAAVSESTPLNPQSPYAEAKASAHVGVQQARAQGRAASNIVLFGHTSELQPAHFALPTICRAAAAIGRGERDRLEVQNPRVRRDWGSARDHVRAFALAAEGAADDYVIGTGTLTQLGEVIEWALAAAGVPDAVVEVTGSDRPTDHDGLVADHSLARRALGWEPSIALREEIERMVRRS